MTRILILLFFPLSIVCQNIDKIFFKKNEVYFSFNYEKKSQLDRLSKIISLDHKIEKTTAYAYANKKQFENFLKEKIEFKLINNQVSFDNISKNNWDYYPTYNHDGMECAIDIYDEDIIYSTSQYGGLRKSYNGGNNWNNIQPVNYSGAWVTPWKVHPINNNIIVAGYDEIYRSQTGGGQWDSISYNVSNGASVRTIALAASDEDYIYSASLSKIKRTKDAGATWVDIKQGLANFNFSDITVDYFDADHVFVTYSEFQANHKVYESFDGGDSWVNITGNGLPNLPVNCIVYQKQANGDIYVGTDVGVYHKDNTMTDWVPYMNGLPNVVVNELEINYNTQKIVAATFGRGIWESDLNTNSTNTYNASFSKIGIYPNPAKDMISIMGINNNNVAVNIYNITGQKVLSINNPINNEIALNSLKKGCYFIEIRGEKIPPITEKLIKE